MRMVAPFFPAIVFSFEELVQFLCNLIECGVRVVVIGLGD